MDWIRLIISTLSIISNGLKTVLLTLLRVVFSLRHIAIYPISVLWKVLLFILNPVIHTFRFILAPFFFILNNIPRFEPIYIYFGSAAFVGVAFGLVFTLTSTGIVSILGLNDSNDSPDHQKKPYARPPPSLYMDEEDSQDYREAGPPSRLADKEQESLEALLANLESPDSDLGSLTMQAWRDSPNTKRKRRSAAALQFSTILEEDDDSL